MSAIFKILYFINVAGICPNAANNYSGIQCVAAALP